VLLSTPTWINQIENTTMNGGVSLFEESSGSQVDREFVAARDIRPTMPFVTSDLTALATIGFNGLALGNAGTTLTAFGRELPFGAVPTPAATAHHVKMVCTDGLLVPVRIHAGHNTVAKLSMMLHGALVSGGGATPFVFSSSSAITSGAGGTSNIYCAGPVKFTVSGGASTLVAGIQDIVVNFGITVLTEGSSSEVYPDHVSIISRMTSIEFTTKDVELATTIEDGVSISSCAVYFRQVNANGQRVAAGTATHASVTGTAGMITHGAMNLSHKRSGDDAFTFTPALNTNLITISTTSTIPTS
jgi:hypothetical protein